MAGLKIAMRHESNAILHLIFDHYEEAVLLLCRSAGSSMDPISVLKIAGVDMTTAAPVNEALKLFGELIDEMEELMA